MTFITQLTIEVTDTFKKADYQFVKPCVKAEVTLEVGEDPKEVCRDTFNLLKKELEGFKNEYIKTN